MKELLASVMVISYIFMTCASASAWKQDRFLITFWCPPPATEENLSRVAAEGYNLTTAPESALDTAKKFNLKMFLEDPLLSPASLDTPEAKNKLAALINRVKKHPALEGYHLTDEPGSGAFPKLGELTAFIKKHDPKHVSYINLFPTYANEQQLGVSADQAERNKVGLPDNFAGAGDFKKTILAYKEHLRLYNEIVKPELISYDHYHFLRNGVDGAQYFLNLALIRENALSNNLPFLNIIQASTIELSWRLVNKNELKWLVYTTLAYGGKGISYFLYWGPVVYGGLYQDGKQTPLALDVADINVELNVIGKEMIKLKSTNVYHTAPIPAGGEFIPFDSPVKIVSRGEFVLGLFESSNKQDTFMIVNRNYKKSASATVKVNDEVYLIKEFDQKTGKWKKYAKPGSDGAITISIEPGYGRLFKMID